MDTLDPLLAKKLEEKAVKQFSEKNSASSKPKKSTPNQEYEHSRVLGKFKSAFPFEIFPDELIISERRVIWIHHEGPWLTRVISVLHQDMADIEVSSGPFIGHLHVRNFTGGEEIIMEHMWKKDLQRSRDLLESLMLRKRIGLKGTNPKSSVQDKLEKMLHVDF